MFKSYFSKNGIDGSFSYYENVRRQHGVKSVLMHFCIDKEKDRFICVENYFRNTKW